jgi:hypothetical protein
LVANKLAKTLSTRQPRPSDNYEALRNIGTAE